MAELDNSATGHQGPTNYPFPQAPLEGDPLWIQWAQDIELYLNRFAVTSTPPGLVTGQSATANNLVTVIQWNAASNATQYRIYRNTSGDFSSAAIIGTVTASKTGVKTLTYQDSQDQVSSTRYYWVQGVNERGVAGPQSAMMTVSNFQNSSTGTAAGIDAVASGSESVAYGINCQALGDETVAIGNDMVVSGDQAVGIGTGGSVTGDSTVGIGRNNVVSGNSAIAIGGNAGALSSFGTALGFQSATGFNAPFGTALGWYAQTTAPNAIALGPGTHTTGYRAIGIGDTTNANHTDSIAIGYGATTTAVSQIMLGDAASSYFTTTSLAVSSTGARTSVNSLQESRTIAASPTTDTTIQIPAKVIVKAVTVRTTTTIPTAATYTVTGATSGTTFSTAAIGTTAGTTDKGNAAGAYYNATAQSIRITPNLTPGAATGVVDVVIIYDDVTPPTS